MSLSSARASTSRDKISTSALSSRDSPGRFINAAKEDNRIKVRDDAELEASTHPNFVIAEEESGDDEEENCLICLGEIVDQCVLPKCRHSLFCFDCIIKWISIHRRCPLCSTAIQDYIIHSIRSHVDYIRHYIPSLNASAEAKLPSESSVDPLRLQADLSQAEAIRVRRQLQQRITRDRNLSTRRSAGSSSLSQREHAVPEWGQDKVEERQRDAIANWDQRLLFRSRIYRERLYCLHIGTNSTSQLSPPISHLVISSSKLVESNLLNFIRRELLAYPLTIDVDFLSRYTIHVFKTFDCKSNEAIDLMAEFLGREGAQHFCHEVYSFGRFIGDGSKSSASGKQRDKVKAFDEWARYERQKDNNGARLLIAAPSQIKEESSIKSENATPQALTPSPSIRQQVQQGRSTLLQRLEGEKKAAKGRDSEIRTDPAHKNTADTSSLDREKVLKAKLALHKRETELREKVLQAQAKRLKT